MTKYAPLTRHLAARKETRVQMSFAEIEALLGFPLPQSARTHRPWWANSGHGHVQARGWLAAGYQSQDVDLAAECLVFARLNAVAPPPQRHPFFGSMAGTITVMPGVDLTEPADPEWGNVWDQVDDLEDSVK